MKFILQFGVFTFFGASSTARDFVNISTADFDAQYTEFNGTARKAAPLETLTIDPPVPRDIISSATTYNGMVLCIYLTTNVVNFWSF